MASFWAAVAAVVILGIFRARPFTRGVIAPVKSRLPFSSTIQHQILVKVAVNPLRDQVDRRIVADFSGAHFEERMRLYFFQAAGERIFVVS